MCKYKNLGKLSSLPAKLYICYNILMVLLVIIKIWSVKLFESINNQRASVIA